MPDERCTHLDQVRDTDPTSDGCENCLQEGTGWVHLRACLVCGHVGCCDSSVGLHARKHWETTGHPLIQSAEPGESWRWCYIDETFLRGA